MKKRVCLLVALLALVIMGFAMNVEAAEIIDRGYCGGEGDGTNLTWTLDRDGMLVIEGQGKMKDWTVEESYPLDDNYHPTDWHKYNEIIISVIVRDGITNIGDFAFDSCTNLSNIELSESLKRIGTGSFYECHSLSSVNLPESLTDIGKYAFDSCYSIDSMILPESLTSIGDGGFYECISLSSINLPRSLKSIGEAAFCGCKSLESIVFPESVVSIEDYTFCNCDSLKNIVLPESLVSIGYHAFGLCHSLENIIFPKTLVEIGADAFWGCDSLTHIDLPESLTSIEFSTFGYCRSLSSIGLPDSLTSIGDRAFDECSSLSSIVLPKSLVSIGEGAFVGCDSLSSIVLPESLIYIERYTFNGCGSLSSITIPSSIKRIYEDAFLDTDLKDIYYEGTEAQWNNIDIHTKNYINGHYDGIFNATIHYVDYDYDKLNDFVSRLYRNFLKREPDEEGLADWVDVLVSGRGTGAKVVSGFVLSPEYKANSLSNEEYVTALYRIIFNREPDEEGLNSWIAVIENGCTIKKVLAGFVNSEEFDNLCSDLGVVRGTYNSDEIADQNVKIAAFVARLYRICLERRYEKEGLNYWVSALASCTMTGSSVVKNFFDSKEFKNRKLDDTSFITTAYRSILDREPDPTGLKSWIDALAKGYTRNNVLSGFLKSAEFDNLCAEYRIASGNARRAKDDEYIPYDLEGMTDRELKLARNEIYARKGYIFNDPEMAEYFGKKEWYKPSIPSKDFDEHIFSDYEWEELQRILSEEETRANEKATLSENKWLMAEIERFLNATPANAFLWSTFREPGNDVDIWSIIDQVGGVGVDYDILMQEVKKVAYLPYATIHYINSDKLDELLYRFTGYGLYEKYWNLKDLNYIKSLDTYYSANDNINLIQVRVKEIKSLGNNIYEVKTEPRYDEDMYDDHYFRTIKLKRIESGGYQFISVQ